MSRDDYDDDDIIDEEDDEELDDDEQLSGSRPRPASPFTTTGGSHAAPPRSAPPGDAGRTSAPGSGRYGGPSNLPGGQRYSGSAPGSGDPRGSSSSGTRPTGYSGSSSGGSDPRGSSSGGSGSYSGGTRPGGYSGSSSGSGGSDPRGSSGSYSGGQRPTGYSGGSSSSGSGGSGSYSGGSSSSGSGGSGSYSGGSSSGGSLYGGARPPAAAGPTGGSSGGGSSPGKGLGGFGSRLGGDKDKKDKPAQPKGASGGGPLSGITSRLGGGKDKKDKPAQPKGASGGGPLSGLTSRFGGQKKDSASSRPGGASGGAYNPPPRSSGMGSGYGGSGASSYTGGGRAAPSSSAPAARPRGGKSGGGLGARLGALLPFGKQSAAARRPATTREKLERASKAPKVEGTGLSLDTQLDILGVVLLIAALLLFFSSISTTKGQLTEPVLTAVAQALGWGAWAVPLAMFAAGLWLVVRHFGERAPVIDPVRLSGLGLLYISVMAIFQYVDSYRSLYTFSALDDFLQLSILDGRGGGWVGAQLYKLLVTNFTEIGGIFILIGMITIGVMLLLRISASELAVFLISIGRSFSDARRRRAQKRAAAARLAEVERAAALAAQAQSQVKVSKPAAGELAEGRPAAALPAAGATQEALPLPEPRPIPITMGGRTFTAFYGEDEDAASMVPAARTPPAEKSAGRGGIAARVRSALPGRPAEKPAPAAKPSPTADSGAPAAETSGSAGGAAAAAVTAGAVVAVGTAGALGRRLFGGRTPPAAAQPASENTPAQPAAALPAPTPAAPAAPPFAAAAPAAAPAPAVPTTDTPAPATPAPATPAPADTGEPLAELVRRPPRRNPVTGELHTPPAPSEAQPAAAPAQNGSDEGADEGAELSHLPPATPKGTVRPAPAPAPAPRPEAAAPDTLAERRARLDAIRAGERSASAPPAAAPDRPTPAATPAGSAAIAAAAAPLSPFRKPDGPPASGPLPPAGQTAAAPARPRKTWKLPDYRTLLNSGSESDFDRETLLQRARIIEETLQSFGAPGRVVEVNTGPVITQFGVEPDYLVGRSGKKSRVKVGAIAQLDKDLQLALGAKSIRIEAPVPGKGYVGIEVPNDQASLVSLRDVMDSDEFKRIRAKSPLAIALGQSVDGAPISADLGSMPHLLIAGTTGSGKSVCVNAIIGCLILSNPPDRVKFIMVDPKRVELTGYNGIPHLVAPVVVDLERIVGVLKWVTREMDERYKRFSSAGARNIEDYNKHLQPDQEIMPYIIVIIDELADLMMLAPDETERVITRIAALARATGIHLVIATQRPSVDVVTGLIKANFPARIAFAVAGGVDSRVILDQPGAERLLGRGDMLYMSGNSPAPVRLQGVFLSDAEIGNITRYWKMFTADADQPRPITALIGDDSLSETARDVMPRGPLAQRAFWDRDRGGDGDDEDAEDDDGANEDGVDELYDEAVELVRRLNKASVSLLQRRLRIGYTRAARLIDMMEEEGIVGPAQEGAKPREVLPLRG